MNYAQALRLKPPARESSFLGRRWNSNSVGLRVRLERVNKELWVLLSLFSIAGLLNILVSSQHVVLAFYTLPTIISAYMYGRRHATLTALASLLLVVLLTEANPSILSLGTMTLMRADKWTDITIWGGVLLVTAYMMGTLYEHKDAQLKELRQTYHGVLMILRHFISKDKYTENHSYRVSVYAAKIAAQMNLDRERIEDVRCAALLHDIGKLDVSRELLYKASRLSESEFEEMQTHVDKGVGMLSSVGGSLQRILPIILSHHDNFDGTGYHEEHGEDIPLEARIIMVADVYDSLSSDRPYRKAMSPFEVREILTKGSGVDFDPEVVDAFHVVFNRGEMEVTSVLV